MEAPTLVEAPIAVSSFGILFPTHAQQTVSLEEAVTIALENHPRLKTATASIERSRASRESWEVSPTTFNYSWGQINGETRNDNQMGSRNP